jgi:hypothetical protein
LAELAADGIDGRRGVMPRLLARCRTLGAVVTIVTEVEGELISTALDQSRRAHAQ